MLMSGHWINNTTMHFIICVRVAMLTLRLTTHITIRLFCPFFGAHSSTIVDQHSTHNAQYEFMKFTRRCFRLDVPFLFCMDGDSHMFRILQFGSDSNSFGTEIASFYSVWCLNAFLYYSLNTLVLPHPIKTLANISFEGILMDMDVGY